MSVNPVKGKFFKLLNGEALRARNAADDGDIEILKVGESGANENKVILGDIPKVVNLTVDSNLSTESYVDGEIDTLDGLKVNKAGDSMTGDLNFSDNFGVKASNSSADTALSATAGVVDATFDDGAGTNTSSSIFANGTSPSASVYRLTPSIEQISGSYTNDAEGANTYAFAQDKSVPSGQWRESWIRTKPTYSELEFTHNNGTSMTSQVLKAYSGAAGVYIQLQGSDGNPSLPSADNHVAVKKYVDDAVAEAAGDINSHLNDAEDAHAASAISVAAGITNLAAEDVQAALSELQGDIDDINGVSGLGSKANTNLDNLVAGTVAIDIETSADLSLTGDKIYLTSNNAQPEIWLSGKLQPDNNIQYVKAGSADPFVISGFDVFLGSPSTDQSSNILLKTGSVTDSSLTTEVVNSGGIVISTGFVDTGAGEGLSGNIVIETGASPNGRGFINLDGSVVNLFSDIDMGSSQIKNLADGVDAADAVNKDQLDDGLALKLDLAGGTMTGNITMSNNADILMGNGTITNLSMTSDPHSAATREYVDNVAEGLHVHAPARAIAVVDIGSANFSAGVIDLSSSPVDFIDGVGPWTVGQRVILSYQEGDALSEQNGIYVVSVIDGIGPSGDIAELSRAADFNSPEEAAGGDFIFVQEGTVYADTGWVQTETVATINVSPIRFLQFSGAGSYQAGDGLDLTGTIFSVNVSEIAGAGLKDDLSNNLAIDLAANSGLNTTLGLAIDSSFAGDGLSLSAGVLAVNAGSGIEIVTDAVQIDLAANSGLNTTSGLAIDSSFAGDGLALSAGVLSVNAGAGIEIVTDAVQIDLAANSGLNTSSGLAIDSSLAGDGLTLSSGVLAVNAGSGIEIVADAVQIDLAANSGLNTSSGLAIDSSLAGDGLALSAGVLSINAGDGLSIDTDNLKVNVGNGIQISSDAVAVKLDGSSLAVSGSGLKSNIVWHKESYAVTSSLSAGATFDLDHVAETDSIMAFVDRLAIHQGEDYTVSYTGGAGGVTQITFIGDLVSPGQSQLTNGDTVFFVYQRKAS